jgi:predicted GH43/DUF377 family glycosyl hydrolase
MRHLTFILLILLLAACSQPAEPDSATATTAVEAAPTTKPTLPPTEAPTKLAPTAEPTDIPSTIEPETTPTPTPLETFSTNRELQSAFTLFSETPVIQREPGNKYLNGGAIIYHDGQYHMFSNFFNSWPGRTVTYYHASPDGQTWTRTDEEPLFTMSDVPISATGALVLTGLVQPDGTWVLYYHTFTAATSPGYIGRITAPAPTGPWTFDESAVLSPGSEGEWDDLQVMRVNVLPTDDGYVMYYAGVNHDNESRIGMASSPDGLAWEKYDNPATNEAPYAESDPILEPEADWEGSWLGRPEVVHTSDGWVMLYEGGRGNQTGIAISEDGVQFKRYEANPFLTQDNMVQGYTFFQGAFFHQADAYAYLIEAGNGAVGTDIYLYTLEGSLFNE